MRGKKTEMMLAAEERLGQSLEKALPEMVTRWGLLRTAEKLGVSKATLSYWLLKLGIRTIRVALSPRETLEIQRAPLARAPQRIAWTQITLREVSRLFREGFFATVDGDNRALHLSEPT